jgi:hypothetical protein
MRITSCRVRALIAFGAQAQRDTVGCEHRSSPLSGRRPQASLKPRSLRKMIEVLDAVRHKQRIARVRDQPARCFGDPKLPLDSGQQQYAAVGGDASAIERRGELPAADGWKAEWHRRIVGHGGCGSVRSRGQDGVNIQSLREISTLCDTSQRIPAMPRSAAGSAQPA